MILSRMNRLTKQITIKKKHFMANALKNNLSREWEDPRQKKQRTWTWRACKQKQSPWTTKLNKSLENSNQKHKLSKIKTEALLQMPPTLLRYIINYTAKNLFDDTKGLQSQFRFISNTEGTSNIRRD